MNDVINIEATDVTAVYEDALSTHQRIMANSEICARSLFEVCKDLKRMRDEKLYEQLGYDTFDSYCEGMAGIKARMAYNYISTYERLGATFLQSNANLGITKLELIAGMNPVERADMIESGELENMSVSEIKEVIRKNKEMGEQINLLEEQLEEAKSTDEIVPESTDTEKDELREQVEKLQDKLLEKDKKHGQEIEDIREKIENELREKLEKEYESTLVNESTASNDNSAEVQKQIDEAVAAALKEREKELKAKFKEKSAQQTEKIKALEETVTAAGTEKEKLQKQLALSDTKSAKAMVYIQAIQDNFNSLFALISEMDAEQQNRFKGAVLKLTRAMQEKASV